MSTFRNKSPIGGKTGKKELAKKKGWINASSTRINVSIRFDTNRLRNRPFFFCHTCLFFYLSSRVRKTGNITFQWWLLLASPVIDDVRLFLIDIRLWLRCCNERWLDSVSIASYLHIGRRPICRPASHFSCDVHQNAHEETVTVLSLSLSFCLTRQPNFQKMYE